MTTREERPLIDALDIAALWQLTINDRTKDRREAAQHRDEAIRFAFNEYGCSLREIADFVGISHVSVRKIVNTP